MGLGVLEDRYLRHPPGTYTLGQDDAGIDEINTEWMKRDGEIILQPQPSDSPNDPLNWSKAWKNTVMIVLAFSSGVTTALGPMVTPGLGQIIAEYKVSPDLVSSFIIGLLVFWTGFTTFFTAAGADIWGKRPFFVISTGILLITCVWGAFASSFVSLAAMRVVQGMASAPLETLVTSTVSDLFFVHERGLRLSLWGMMLGSGVLLGQIISGFIIQSMGVPSTFGVSAIIYCVLLPLMYFVVVETTYNKPRENNAKFSKEDEFYEELPERKESYPEQLAIFRGRLSDRSFWKGVLKPLPLVVFPAVLFSTVVYATFFAWLLVISLLSVSIFEAPPYNLNAAQVGLTNVPLFITALIASPLSGWMADAAAKGLAKRNRGIFEPEFRLTLMLVAVPLSTAGFIGFGEAVFRGLPLAFPLLFMTLHSIAVPFASQASLSYVIDCHRSDANQAFVTINFAKAILTFVATSYVNGLYVKYGPRAVFTGLALLNLVISLLTIPAYVYGKRMRSMVARSDLAKKISST